MPRSSNGEWKPDLIFTMDEFKAIDDLVWARQTTINDMLASPGNEFDDERRELCAELRTLNSIAEQIKRWRTYIYIGIKQDKGNTK